MKSLHRLCAALLCLTLLCLTLGACSKMDAGKTSSVDWPNPGGDAGKTHHSPLTQIKPDNVNQLGLAWSVNLGSNRVLEATPVVINGVMYTTGVMGRTYAFDAATGKEKWVFMPQIDMQSNRYACCDQANRGVVVARGKVYVATLDGVLYALDANTGQPAWKADMVVDHQRGITSTGAPEIAGDVVIMGMAGAEMDVRGYVSAYDLDTGALKWRFYIVPHDPKLGPQESPELEAAIKTWDRNSRWDIGGGGAPWDAIHYDAETGLVIVGTGNAGPYPIWKRSPSGGDNLYIGSLIALDPKTGRMKWHYQETPQDSWDFTATQPMILTRMTIDGEDRPVVIHAPKNGFLYVLDRRDGKLLRANPIVRTNWATGIDMATGRPVLSAAADYSKGPKIVFPTVAGARNWYAGSFDAKTGLYYAHVLDMGMLIFTSPGKRALIPKRLNADSAILFTNDLLERLPSLPPPLQAVVTSSPEYASIKQKPYASELRAIDPLTGETKWAVPTAGWQDRSGVLTTDSGLLFAGSIDGSFNVYDKNTGKLLKKIDVGTSIMAAPMTYEINGVQYVAVMAAWGGGGWGFVPRYSAAYKRGNQGRLLVFKLGGSAVEVPPELPPLTITPEAPEQLPGVTPQTLAKGHGLFLDNCIGCHSNQPRAGAPDLRRMSPQTHALFSDILLKGLYVPAGMPRWDDLLSEDDVNTLHAWLIDAQRQLRTEELAKQAKGIPLDAPAHVVMSNF